MSDENQVLKRNVDESSTITEINDSPKSIPPKMTFQEKKMVVVLTLLYFIQGIPLGLWGGALSVLFTESGASFNSLAILPNVLLPFSFKMITAPILDTFYFSSVGKRRTYILPIQYMMAFLFFLLGFADIDEWVRNQRIVFAAAVGFVMIFFAAQQDIAVDGWVLTSLSEPFVHIGASCQSVGQVLGGIYASNLLISLNSKSFCNRFIFSEPQDLPLLTLKHFCFMTGAIILVVNLYVNFFTQEKDEPIDHPKNTLSPFEQVKYSVNSTVIMLKNPNVRTLFLYLLTYRYGYQPIQSSFGTKLQMFGFPKELTSMVSTLFLPIAIVIPIVVGSKIKQGSEFTLLFTLYKLRLVDTAFQYLIVTFYDELGGFNNITTALTILSMFINFCLMNLAFVIHSGFFNRISDTDVGGTYLTFLNSCHNLGATIASSVSLYLIGTLGFDIIIGLSFVYAIIYYFEFKGPTSKLQELEKSAWKIK